MGGFASSRARQNRGGEEGRGREVHRGTSCLTGLCRVRESQAIGSLAEGSCEGREGGGGRPCRCPECSRAQAPHLRLAVRGPGWRSSKEEYLLALDHHTSEIMLARQQAANQHLASCEAEEEALCRRAGKRPRTRALVARRKRSCERRGF